MCHYCEGTNLRLACKTCVAYVTGVAENQLVEERVGSKGKKKNGGSWKTPWWSDYKQGEMPSSLWWSPIDPYFRGLYGNATRGYAGRF